MINKKYYSGKTDEELAGLVLKNNEFYLLLMERYENKLLRYITRISSLPKEDAKDVLQETFIKTYRNINGLDPSLKFSSWIYRIAHNETINFIRKVKKLRASANNPFNENELEGLVSKINHEEEFNKKYLAERVSSILEKMDEKYKTVLILKFIEQKSYKEISDILKKPMGTIATLINRAKKQFKEITKKMNYQL